MKTLYISKAQRLYKVLVIDIEGKQVKAMRKGRSPLWYKLEPRKGDKLVILEE